MVGTLRYAMQTLQLLHHTSTNTHGCNPVLFLLESGFRLFEADLDFLYSHVCPVLALASRFNINVCTNLNRAKREKWYRGEQSEIARVASRLFPTDWAFFYHPIEEKERYGMWADVLGSNPWGIKLSKHSVATILVIITS